MKVNSVYRIKHLKTKQTGREEAQKRLGESARLEKRARPLFEKFKVILPNLGHFTLVLSRELSFVRKEKANK